MKHSALVQRDNVRGEMARELSELFDPELGNLSVTVRTLDHGFDNANRLDLVTRFAGMRPGHSFVMHYRSLFDLSVTLG